jgi:hypothetical protein
MGQIKRTPCIIYIFFFQKVQSGLCIVEFLKRSGLRNVFFFSFYMNGKALRFICSESISVLKECNIARHYNSKHKVKYKKLCRYSEKRESGDM